MLKKILQKIFSLKNKNEYKILTFFGIKFYIKREITTAVKASDVCDWEVLVYPEEKFRMDTKVDVSGYKFDILNKETTIPPFYVRGFKNGLCKTKDAEMFISCNKVIEDYTHLKINPRVNQGCLKERKIKKINGKVVHLGLNSVENNYYHWYIDAMSRLYLILKANIKPDYYIVSQKHQFQKEFIKLLGIKPEQVIDANVPQIIQADELIAASNLRGDYEEITNRGCIEYHRQWLPSWIGNLCKEYIIPQFTGYGIKKIYITRKNAKYRKILNEKEIINILKEYDFCILDCDKLSLQEQIKYFKDAEYIVSIHGAGLTNALYTQGHKCSVFEFYSQYYHDPGYRILYQVLGINHKMMVGKTENLSRVPQQENMYIDPEKFRKELIDMITNK